MDGRKAFPSRNLPFLNHLSKRVRRNLQLLAVVALTLCPGAVFAQAMGRVTLDPPAANATTAPAAGANAIAATAPAVPLAPSLVHTTKPIAPEAQAKESPGDLAAPLSAASAAPTTLPALSQAGPEPAVKPPLVAAKTAGDSMPADPTQAITPPAPLRPIEHQEIRPQPASTQKSAQTQGASTTTPWGLPAGLASVLQVAAALAIVIGLIFIGKALARRFMPGAKAGNGKGVIEILARYPIAKNQSLVLVRIGSQIVTLNQGKDQSHSVLVISDPNEVAKIVGQIEGTHPKSIQAGFNRLLANARMDLENTDGAEKEDFEATSMEPQNLDSQLEEMAAAKRQLMELRQQVRSVRDSLPR